MSDDFNPYHTWLGLDRRLREPSYFELLGLDEGEDDRQKITVAADRSMARVRSQRPGPRAALWAALLDEIAAAKRCLTDPTARAEYLGRFRAESSDASSPATVHMLLEGTTVALPPRSPSEPSPVRDASATTIGLEDTRVELPGYAAPPPPLATESAGAGESVEETFGPLEEFAPSSFEPAAPVFTPVSAPMAVAPVPPPPPPPVFEPPAAPPRIAPEEGPVAVASPPVVPIPFAAQQTAAPPPNPLGKSGGRRPAVRKRPRLVTPRTAGLASGFILLALAAVLSITDRRQARPRATDAARAPTIATLPGDSFIRPKDSERPFLGASDRMAPLLPPEEASPEASKKVPSEPSTAPQEKDASAAAPSEPPESEATDNPFVTPPSEPSPAPPPEASPKPQGDAPASGKEPVPAPATPKPEPSGEDVHRLRETLKSARRALAKWNFGEVNRQLARADGLAHTDTQRVIVNGMRDLAQHTRRFHEAIQKAAQNLKAGTELKVGDDILSMVEANRDRIVVRHKGANRRFALDELPPDLAMALGEKGMSADEPMAVLRKAAYVAVSARSDAATARAREMLVAESRKMPEVQRIIDALDESSDSKASESRGVSPTKANSTGSR